MRRVGVFKVRKATQLLVRWLVTLQSGALTAEYSEEGLVDNVNASFTGLTSSSG